MFSSETFHFLSQLSANNNKAWFDEHKPRYEANVREPALDFIRQMQAPLTDISSHMLASDKKVGGSLMRVYKDVRFSKDKTPYKTNIGIQFRHFMGKDVHAPGYYLHISNQGCFVGAGIWRPDSKALAKIRHCIDENPRSYLKATENEFFGINGFEMSGQSLVRPPKGYDKTHPMLEHLKRKDFIAVRNISVKQVTNDHLVEFCTEHFKQMSPLMAYLCFALEVPF